MFRHYESLQLFPQFLNASFLESLRQINILANIYMVRFFLRLMLLPNFPSSFIVFPRSWLITASICCGIQLFRWPYPYSFRCLIFPLFTSLNFIVFSSTRTWFKTRLIYCHRRIVSAKLFFETLLLVMICKIENYSTYNVLLFMVLIIY